MLGRRGRTRLHCPRPTPPRPLCTIWLMRVSCNYEDNRQRASDIIAAIQYQLVEFLQGAISSNQTFALLISHPTCLSPFPRGNPSLLPGELTARTCSARPLPSLSTWSMKRQKSQGDPSCSRQGAWGLSLR